MVHFTGKWPDARKGGLCCYEQSVHFPSSRSGSVRCQAQASQCLRWTMGAHRCERRRAPGGALAQGSAFARGVRCALGQPLCGLFFWQKRTDWRAGNRWTGHSLCAPRAWRLTDLAGHMSLARSLVSGISKAILACGATIRMWPFEESSICFVRYTE
jgi:hypothetical protein